MMRRGVMMARPLVCLGMALSFVLLLLGAGPIGLGQATAQETATIGVVVTDPEGAPIEGAFVGLETASGTEVADGTTDGNGSVRFGGVAAGSYVLYAEARGYTAARTGPFSVLVGQVVDKEVMLSKPPAGTVSVSVKNAIGLPIASATVYLDGPTPSSQDVGGFGEAVFSNLMPGEYFVTVISPQGSAFSGPVAVEAGSEIGLTLTVMSGGSRTTGTAVIEVFSDANPPQAIPGAVVRLINLQDESQILDGQTDGWGVLRFDELSPGDYALDVRVYDANQVLIASSETELTITAGKTILHRVTASANPVPTTGTLTVTLRDEGGGSIVGGSVAVESPIGTVTLATDGAGEAVFADLPPGDLTVTASAGGFVGSGPLLATMQPGQVATLEIRLVLSGEEAEPPLSPTPLPPDVTAPPQPPTDESGARVAALPSTGAGSVSGGLGLGLGLGLAAIALIVVTCAVAVRWRLFR